MANHEHLHIGLLLNRESVYGRGIMRGFMANVRPSRKWKISIGRLSIHDANKLISLKPDGIIAEVSSPRVAALLDASGIPYIDIAEVVKNISVPRVYSDNHKVGQMAAEHFMERGFTNFAYFGGKTAYFSQLREVGFANVLHEHGRDYSRFMKTIKLDFYGSNILGESSESFHKWLMSLPKPVAIFTCNDAYALIVNETCRELGIHVPDKVAILGVDNDEQFCQLETPAISSIELPLWQIGSVTAELIEELATGRQHDPILKRLAPIGIVQRQSTDIVAFDNELLAEAVRYIREHADQPMTVEGVCDALCISRRLLEKNMRNIMGHSPLMEINRVHIERTKELLLNSNLTLPQIATASGFNSPERMSVLFKKFTGTTPSRYRKLFSKK